MIRRKGKLEIYTDCHRGGLFSLETWFTLLKDSGFKIKQIKIDHLYDDFILGGGEYPLRAFIAGKPLL